MFDGSSGSSPMPRKIAGRLMITIEQSSVAMKAPSVVFDSAVHLYRLGTEARSVMRQNFTSTSTSLPMLRRSGAPLEEELLLALVLRERGCPPELDRCIRGSAELLEQVASDAVEQVVAIEGARRAQLVHEVESDLWAGRHRDRDCSVELN